MADSNQIKSFIDDAVIQTSNPDLEFDDLLYVPKETYNPIPYVLQFGSSRCMPLGEISTVSGKAKAGKSAFFNLLLKALFVPSDNYFMKPTNIKISKMLYFDTEQSENTIDFYADRIRKTTGITDLSQMIHFFSLRDKSTEERVQHIERVLSIFDKPNSRLSKDCNYIVVIDGIRDLISNFNDNDQSTALVNRLLKWACDYRNCAFVCVLHENPRSSDDKMMRGALGTELENKMFTNFQVKKNSKNAAIRDVVIGASRGAETEDVFQFSFDEHGIPAACDDGDAFFTQEVKTPAKPTKPTSADNHIMAILNSNHWQFGESFTKKEFVDFFAQLTGKKERTAEAILKSYTGIYWVSSGSTSATKYKFIYKEDEDDENDD